MLNEILPQWIIKNMKVVSIAAGALVLWFGWQCLRVLHSEPEPIEEIFAAWQQNPEDPALYQNLKAASKKISGPTPLFAKIAQSLLTMKRVEEAESFARGSIEQLRKVAPAYAEFAEISFLISQNKIQLALERAVSLKEALEGEKNSALYSKNLLRIAFLHQLLDNRAGETAAWVELQELIEFQGKRKVLDGLAYRESDFQAYLEERKRAL